MKAPSDDRPYARETADFRKEQVDQSREVGDQSLTGYWTRGQLSFHRGAGITYYEVLDGDGVIDRFTDALNVHVWEPGEVSVKATRSAIVTDDAAYGFLYDGGFATISTAGIIKKYAYAGGAGTTKAPTAGTPTWLASDGTNLYIAVSNRIERAIPGGAFATLWTHHTGGKTFTHVFWAKSRLWAFDSDGQLFELTTAGAVTTDAMKRGTALGSGKLWSCADSPGGVFFAADNLIYLVSLDGQTTTVGAPTTVAQLGRQETIGTIGAYLGYLVVASSKGIRMGRIGGSAALEVILGELIVEADASACRRVTYRDSLVLVTGIVGTTTYLYEVNVLEQTSDLTGAYAPVRSNGTNQSDHSSLIFPDGTVATTSEDGVLAEGTFNNATGYITTGFHRFGTLELKDFRTVSVYARGTAGTIGVSLIRRDGVEYPLVTLGTANFGGDDIALNMPSLTDYIGLKFTITANSSGVAPVLLGYQLRAMPAPVRQRLIQVPLMCFDTEEVGNVTKGSRGNAWSRLEALEDMERASGVVPWQDFDTGEVAQVLIERIQFQGKTPSLSDKNGFGGFIMVTMRKVA